MAVRATVSLQHHDSEILRETEPTVLGDTREVASVVVTAVHSVLSRQLLMMAIHIINLQQQPDPKRPIILPTGSERKGCDVVFSITHLQFRIQKISFQSQPVPHLTAAGYKSYYRLKLQMHYVDSVYLLRRRWSSKTQSFQIKRKASRLAHIRGETGEENNRLETTSVWCEGNHFPTATALNFTSNTYVGLCQACVRIQPVRCNEPITDIINSSNQPFFSDVWHIPSVASRCESAAVLALLLLL